ncbi:MAG: hypothetical protein ACK5B5_03500 [Bacteroidota bacterium]|jgi:hypothetical protein
MRARLIKEINRRYLEQAGKELIVREKNSEDRRFIRYTIQALSVENRGNYAGI